jgi:hypothetical protein
VTEKEWRALLQSFVMGELDGLTFERRFLDGWRSDRDTLGTSPYAIERLFYEVDAYCGYPELRGPQDLDEAGLRDATIEALARFDEPRPPAPPRTPADLKDEKLLDDVRRAVARLGRS